MRYQRPRVGIRTAQICMFKLTALCISCVMHRAVYLQEAELVLVGRESDRREATEIRRLAECR